MTTHETNLDRRVYAAATLHLEMGNEAFDADGARFVCNRQFPHIYDANHVTHVRCESGPDIERLLARAEQEYDHCGHRRFDVDPWTPPAFVARLVLEGYAAGEGLQLVLEGELRAQPTPCDIRRVETEEQWVVSDVLHEMDWVERCQRLGRPVDLSVPAAFAALRRTTPGDIAHWRTPMGSPSRMPGRGPGLMLLAWSKTCLRTRTTGIVASPRR